MSAGIYTVAMVPITAGAKRATDQVNFEYEALSAAGAIAQAKNDCQWVDPERNFAWRIIDRRVPAPATPTGVTAS